MKKRLTFITLLMLFCSTMFGQGYWGNVPNYESTMTLFGTVQINGEDQNRTDLEIAAFCGDELRGVTQPIKFGNKYVLVFTIGGLESYEIIRFKLYDPVADKELGSEYTTVFIPEDKVGSLTNFIPINFIPMYWDESDVVSGQEQSMVVKAVITMNGLLQDRGDLELAAFCGDELRDIARPIYYERPQQFITDFYINGKSSEVITFKLYDHSADAPIAIMPYSSDYSVDFVEDGTIGQDAPVTINFACPIAQIKETEEYFYTLAEAVVKATGGQTITLLRNAEGAGVVIDKDVTIDFGDFTYTFNEGVGDIPSNGFQIKKNNNVTLKNGTLNVAASEAGKFYILVQNYSNLTVDGMTLDGTNLDKWSKVENNYDSYVLSNNSGSVNVTGTTKIIANNDGALAFALDACYNPSYTAPVVTLGEDVTVEGKVEVTGGQLYTNAALQAVVKKTVEGSSTGWGTLSSPTAEGNVVFSTSTGHDFYQYVESENLEWDNIGGNFNSYTMTVGRGYLYANTEDTEVSFEGTLNHEDVNYTLSYTQKDLAGFNFIGNPFTHNITAAHLSGNKTEGYYVVGENGTFEVRNTTEETIAPFQAILVQATEEAGTLTIQKTAPATQTREASNGALEIVVANTDYKDVAYVSFNDGIGLEKIGHQNASAPLVYVTAENKKFAIATMKQDVNEIPVSFVAKTMGQYTISVETVDCEFNEMYLTDRMTGEKVNLLLEDYTFVATSNDNADRFVISFATTKPESVAENFIYINNGNMIINNIEGNAVVRVLDVLGRPVAEYNVTESANISTATLSSGVYMIQMYDNNGVKVQKIVVE